MKATSVSSIDAKTRVAGACIGFVSNVDYREDMTSVKDARRICLGVSKQVFTEMFNGCRDLSSLRPDKIGVTICQWLKLD